MSAPPPLEKLRLRHQYDLDPDEMYTVQGEFAGYGFAAEELNAADVHELLGVLLTNAEQALDQVNATPQLNLVEVYRVDEEGDYDPCESGWDIENRKCLDCGADTVETLNEYYMVLNAVWLPAVPEYDGMVCIGCLEQRLGRELVRSDFIDAPINAVNWMRRSPRLTARLAGSTPLTPIDW